MVISYAKVTIPDDCSLYVVKTSAPKGLGNFDRHISAYSVQDAKNIWKDLYSYMGKTVRITGVEKIENAHDKIYDRAHCDITGRLIIHKTIE